MGKVIKVDGHVFASMTDMAKHFGIKRHAIFNYRHNHPGASIEDIYWHFKNDKYIIEGKAFSSISQVARFFNISPQTLSQFLRRHNNSMEDAYEFYKNKDVYGRRYHTYLIDGMEFFGQKDIANYLGINIIQFQNYMYRNGISIERAYYHFKSKRLQEEKKNESKEYQH